MDELPEIEQEEEVVVIVDAEPAKPVKPTRKATVENAYEEFFSIQNDVRTAPIGRATKLVHEYKTTYPNDHSMIASLEAIIKSR